jgi:hypothetical protein
MEPVYRFLRTLRFLLRFYQWAQPPDWEQGDAENLAKFMESSVGKKLALRLRNASLRHNSNAVQEANPHGCGVAAGYMLCLTDLSALAVFGSSGAVKPDTPQPGDFAQEGESEFLERLSP